MVQQAGLSPSQREQVIQALLAERRSRLQSEQQPAPAAPKVCAAEREQRLQQLIQQRQQAASQGEPNGCGMSEGLLSPGSSTSVASYHGPTPVIPPPATSILQQAAVAAEAAARQAKLQQPQQQREQPRQQRQQPLPAPSSWAAAGGQGGRYSAASPSLFGAAGSGGGEAYGGPVDVSSLWQAGDSSQDSLGSDPDGDSATSGRAQHTSTAAAAAAAAARRRPAAAAPAAGARGRSAVSRSAQQQQQQQQQQQGAARRSRSLTPGRTPARTSAAAAAGGNRHSRAAALARAVEEEMAPRSGVTPSPGRRTSPLPASYPTNREERLQQLAAPRVMAPEKALQLQAQREAADLAECRFHPTTGRPPDPTALHAAPRPDLPAAERLYAVAQEAARRRAKKAGEQAAAELEGCTFAPSINAAATERHLAGCHYEPLHRRLGQLLRNRAERRAALQQAVEEERRELSPHAPAINPSSARLAEQRKQRLAQEEAVEQQQQQQRGRSMARGPRGVSASPHVAAAAAGGHGGGGAGRRCRSVSACAGMRRARSEADLAGSQEGPCTFSPAINRRSAALLASSTDIPGGFLARQAWFWARAQEKAAALAAALEDGECSFSPSARGEVGAGQRGRGEDVVLVAGSRHSELVGETYLERIERLAYKDAAAAAARRQVAAEAAYASCTFTPAINPRSAKIGKATPLQELYENNRAKARRAALAAEQAAAEEEACRFHPDTSASGRSKSTGRERRSSSPGAGAYGGNQLSASGEDWVDRLYPAAPMAGGWQQAAAAAGPGRRAGRAPELPEERELGECTFRPAINRKPPPQPKGPVPVRGLGRFLELKALAAAKSAAAAEREAAVFHTRPTPPAAPFTIPQPFRLTPPGGPRGAAGRKGCDQIEAAPAAAGKGAGAGGSYAQGAGGKGSSKPGAVAVAAGGRDQGGAKGPAVPPASRAAASRALIQAILDGEDV